MTFPTRHRLFALVAPALLLACGLAHAGALYKCAGPGGATAYTNKPGSFHGCSLVSTYADPAPARKAPRRAPTSPPDAPAVAEKAAVAALPESAAVPNEPMAEASAPGEADDPLRLALAAPGGSVNAGLVALGDRRLDGARIASVAPATPAAPTSASVARVLRGAVYKVERAGGITEYTNIKPSGTGFAVLFTYIATCVACDVHSTIDWDRTPLHMDVYRAEIARAAAEFGVDAALLRAVIHAESAFNPYAISHKGAQGLMQLMPATATDLGVVDPFDAFQNIRGGARYLADLLRSFGGDERLATAAFNAGPGAVQKYGTVPPYDETRLYVDRVVALHERYRKAL